MKNKYDEKLLEELVKITKINIVGIPLDEKEIIEMFSKNNVIKNIHPICNHSLNGIHECSSVFYNSQIKLVSPKNLNQISKLIAFAYTTDGWIGNASELLKNNSVSLDELVATREDLYDLLINSNVRESVAKEIIKKINSKKLDKTENKEIINLLINLDVPKWCISFLSKVKYLPRREIIQEITLVTYRLAWFKKNYTKDFYNLLFKLYNNEEILKYKDFNDLELSKVLIELKNITNELNPNDYNSIDEYNSILSDITHKSTILFALMEINKN